MGSPAQTGTAIQGSLSPRNEDHASRHGKRSEPVESGTRGTVRVIDDIGTLHCDFDNGRSLGVVPGEDSFRKLTDEELAEEQTEDMDEDESGPVMGM